MKITKIDKTNEKVKYIISLEANEWSEIKHSTFNKLVNNLKIVGFRKGHVPLEIAKKHITSDEITSEAMSKACQEAHRTITIPEIIEKQNDIFPDTFSYGIERASDEKLDIRCEFFLFPVVTLPDYKNMGIKFKSTPVSDKEISAKINDLIKKDTLLMPKQTDVIEAGDIVIFDFKGFIDDKAFEGGEANFFELEIGSNQFIPGFEQQMIGLKKNETKSITVVFPRDYHAPKFAGKKARFDLLIRDIKVLQKPTLDDAYIKSLHMDGIQTKQELENYISSQIKNQHMLYDKQTNMALIYDYLKKNASLSYMPDFILSKEIENIKNSMHSEASKHHQTFEEFVNKKYQVSNGNSTKNLLEKLGKENVVLIYALSRLLKELDIRLNDDDRQNYYQEISNIYHVSVSEVKKMINENENVDEIILQNKLVEKLMELNK